MGQDLVLLDGVMGWLDDRMMDWARCAVMLFLVTCWERRMERLLVWEAALIAVVLLYVFVVVVAAAAVLGLVLGFVLVAARTLSLVLLFVIVVHFVVFL